MRCFACDLDVGDQGYDRDTDRYYCNTCIEPTHDVQLNQELREASGEGSVTNELVELLDSRTSQEELIPFEEAFPDEDEEE